MHEEKTNTLLIKTPEGIIFSMLLAGPLTRFLAWGIDLACIFVVSSILGILLGIFGLISLDFSRALTVLAYFFISISYSIVTEWYWRGQTIGKRLLRLRVMDVQGLRLQFSQIMIRNLMRFVDSLPAFYFIGGAACLISKRAQRLGDFAANTIVIRNPKIVEPALNQLLAGKYNSLREYPHLCARLRQNVTPKEAGIALQSLLRRNELEPLARVELFEKITSHFRSIVEFPDEATYGITDEQYIRNLVDILFNS
ncbi:MAG TPA: RDD family protein [Thermodesulfovibrionia bacterium]|nr:MAG: transporter [Planctomycetes bacterium RIFCSPLOWO2_12_FULL_40_19]HLA50321.1 RDD family protein [Thermodesulfovibrionia bacterium]